MNKKAIQFLLTGLFAAVLIVGSQFAARSAAQPGDTYPRDENFQRVFFSIAATIVLLTPTFCLFVLQRRDGASSQWRNFSTFAYVAFLVHLYWAIFGMMGGDAKLIFTRPDLVSAPWLDLVLTVWWAIDLWLAWTVSPKAPWARLQRGAFQLALFLAFVLASIPQGQGLVRVLGVLMLLAVLICVGIRVVTRRFDPDTLTAKLYVGAFRVANVFAPWHHMPTWLGILNLGAYRETLRKRNLHNTSTIPVSNPDHVIEVPPYRPDFLLDRDDQGFYNDLHKGSMGCASARSETSTPDSMYFDRSHPGARFGRNVPLDDAFVDEANLLHPNPRLISERLLKRTRFEPARSLNLLAAAWIQFETHDWFNHGEPPFDKEKAHNPRLPFTDDQIRPHEVPLPDGDTWGTCPMKVRPTRPDPTRDYERERLENNGRLKYPKTYVNAESHWWDASQIYGSNLGTTRLLRSDYQRDEHGDLVVENGRLVPIGELPDGKLFLDGSGLSLDPSTGTALAGFTGNWWVGLSLLHTLFTREHNAICDAIRREYPLWPGDEVFRVARLVNSALIAKIHTVEWTPAILQHPALQIGMRANWWGLLGESTKRVFGRLSENEAFSGIPGLGVDHGTSEELGDVADFCLTEEFVSVYRLHPLMPDEFQSLSVKDGRTIKKYRLPDGIIGDAARLTALRDGATMSDLFYSFGVSHPGAVTLHNYPNFLRDLERPQAFGVTERIDLATVDILRDRERGVPRYNQFARRLRRKPIKSFDDFQNPLFPDLGKELREVYGTTDGRDNVELLDTMVGMFAEVVPEGFGFSDTAFRVFILMASRRLKSDRFIAGEAYSPQVYTQVGYDWVERTSMIDVLLRHYPDLGPALYGVDNAFVPWKHVESNPAT